MMVQPLRRAFAAIASGPIEGQDATERSGRLSKRESAGLTTLEWLLIVAAVAGLAALAVVLVQNVVDETAEEISGSNARVTAARVAAARITSEARADLPDNTDDGWRASDGLEARKKQQGDVNNEYSSKCARLNITYSDAGVDAMWHDASTATATGANTRGSRSDLANDNVAWADQSDTLCKV